MAMGARTKRAKRIAKAFDIVADLSAHGKDCDSVFWARREERKDWFELTLPISINARYDDPRNESNYYIARDLINKVSPYGADYRVDLWPGGQIHTLTIRMDDALAVREAESIIRALQDYPVLDDEDCSEREWEANHPGEFECFSDNEDCDCGRLI